VRAGGRLVLVPTNASSFRDAQVPAQEVTVARLRAIETGRWVVQAAPTGYSAIVDHRGRVRARSGLGRPALLAAEPGLRSGSTVFVVLGSTPWLAAALTFLVVSMMKVESKQDRFVDRSPRELLW
jgi:apolipoprotein N-acyltransferase